MNAYDMGVVSMLTLKLTAYGSDTLILLTQTVCENVLKRKEVKIQKGRERKDEKVQCKNEEKGDEGGKTWSTRRKRMQHKRKMEEYKKHKKTRYQMKGPQRRFRWRKMTAKKIQMEQNDRKEDSDGTK
jgi:hypothetical protein